MGGERPRARAAAATATVPCSVDDAGRAADRRCDVRAPGYRAVGSRTCDRCAHEGAADCVPAAFGGDLAVPPLHHRERAGLGITSDGRHAGSPASVVYGWREVTVAAERHTDRGHVPRRPPATVRNGGEQPVTPRLAADGAARGALGRGAVDVVSTPCDGAGRAGTAGRAARVGPARRGARCIGPRHHRRGPLTAESPDLRLWARPAAAGGLVA